VYFCYMNVHIAVVFLIFLSQRSCSVFLLISRSLDHDHNETEDAFDTRLTAVTHEASMDVLPTIAPENVTVVK